MKRCFLNIIIFVIFISIIGCNEDKPYIGKIIREGYFECFPQNVTYDNQSPVSAEISGVLYYHNKIILINDKKVPGTTSVLTAPYKLPFEPKDVEYIGNQKIKNASKFEDITITPNLRYIFYITSFDRVKKDKPGLDSYNTLLYNDLDSTEGEKIAYPFVRNGVESSLLMRYQIRKSLSNAKYRTGPPYFKVEGIAALPEKILLLGIREIGNSYSDFEYTITIIGAHYEITDGNFYFTEPLRIMWQFDPAQDYPLLKNPLGLSSIEYDSFNKQLYVLTSYEHGETDDQIGSYLWILPLKNFMRRQLEKKKSDRYFTTHQKFGGKKIKEHKKIFLESSPILVMQNDFKPLHFAHKAEGVTVLDRNSVLIFADDDRITGTELITDPENQFKRKLNEAAYYIVEFK